MTPRTVVVTGAASGMGAAARRRLEAGGAHVIGVDRQESDVTADLSTAAGREQAITAIHDATGGRVQGLVLAAGLGLPNDDPAAVVSVNHFGAEAILSAVRPALAANERSHAVVVASNSITVVPDVPADLVEACLEGDEARARSLAVSYGDTGAYAASKTAIARLVRRWAPGPAWAGAGIRLNAIAPGATDTPMFRRSQDDPTFKAMFELLPIPVGDVAPPEAMATWIEILLGDAAEHVCGQVIAVDGGVDALARADDWPTTYSMGQPADAAPATGS